MRRHVRAAAAIVMQKLRLAILGESPCDQCFAACCKQNGHDFAVLLQGDEVRKFAPFAVDVHIQRGDQLIPERVLPYRNERCQFLGNEDRCTIYDDRPQSCRTFQCVKDFNREGIGEHGRFLKLNPRVRELLESL
jgi:Fe-S-cluster containining protein